MPMHIRAYWTHHVHTLPFTPSNAIARPGTWDASDFDPTFHADFGAATHLGVGGGTHRRRAAVDRC